MVKIRFCGAASEVTGSCHYVETEDCRFLLDCGLFQGGEDQFERNEAPFPFDPGSLDFVLLSHAHIDHIGRLPLLVQRGFHNPIYATSATRDLCRILLLDSAHLHEEDAGWKIHRLKKRGEDASWVHPLYTRQEVEATLPLLVSTEYEKALSVNDRITVWWYDAGHLLGSAHLQIRLQEKGKTLTLVFSGDIGNRNTPILKDPTRLPKADILLIESTYGDRSHEHWEQRMGLLAQIVRETRARGGKVIIPAFAVGRTQEILYALNTLEENGQMDPIPVYVDSPMATEVTKVFYQHPEDYDAEALRLLKGGDDPLSFPNLHWVCSVEESKALNDLQEPAIIISANGMCTGGRIKHHLKHNIGDPRNTLLFVGFQAQGTLGRQIKEGAREVRIFGEMYPVRARVASIEGFSTHADREGLLWWIEGFQQAPQCSFIVHGEEKIAHSFAQLVAERKGWSTQVPHLGEEFKF